MAEGATVIIAAKDAEATIARAVESALVQPEAVQVIVVDDGSCDQTAEAARAASGGSDRMLVRRLKTNVGPSAARNLALSLATAPLVCILDADDFMLPSRLAKLAGRMGDCDAVADDLLRVHEGHEDQAPVQVMGIDHERQITLAEFLRANIGRPRTARAEWGFLKPLFRRDFLERHGLAYDERVRLGEDFLLYANALQRGASFRLTPPCGYVAVEREGSLSHAHSAADLRALLDGAEALAARGVDGEARRELSIYRAHVARKLHHREVLAARKAQGMLGALKALSQSPATAGYVITQTLNDKIATATSAGRRAAAPSAP